MSTDHKINLFALGDPENGRVVQRLIGRGSPRKCQEQPAREEEARHSQLTEATMNFAQDTTAFGESTRVRCIGKKHGAILLLLKPSLRYTEKALALRAQTNPSGDAGPVSIPA